MISKLNSALFFLILLVYSSLHYSHHTTIVRTTDLCCGTSFTSLIPNDWITRTVRSMRTDKLNCIKEIIYIPSMLSQRESSDYDCVFDDENCCSLLCESGIQVLT